MHEAAAVVLSGGGTGGHLYPALAIAEALRRRRPDVRLVFVGARRGVEARVLPARGEEHLLLPVEGIQRGRALASWKALPALLLSLVRSVRLLRRVHAQVVVVTGGYAGAPAGLAAALTGTPLVLQEQNVQAGATTRLLSRWALRIFVAFPEAAGTLAASVRERTVFTGNPVRPASPLSRIEAREALGLPARGTVVLVTGGSQGAAGINRVLLEAVGAVERGELDRPPEVRLYWVTGPSHYASVLAGLSAVGRPEWVHAVAYAEDMPAAMAAADLAICRAGAMTTAELAMHALPAILVPLPTAAADHQTRNAEALEAAGSARHLPEADLSGRVLWAGVTELVGRPDRLRAMAVAAAGRARPAAADEIAAEIAALLPTPGGAS